MKIAVLAGGFSPERDVSLCSGSLIANALIENGHSVSLVDLYKGSDDTDFYDKSSGKTYNHAIPAREPNLLALMDECGNNGALIGKNVIEICRSADLTFFALHGAAGENGQLSATLDMFGIKYTGTGYAGCLLAMDKDIAKRLMIQSGIKTPDWVLFDTVSGDLDLTSLKISPPCAVKPCGCGSSVGVSLVYSDAELLVAIKSAQKYERFLIIEKLIKGREFSVGILGGKALPVIEIIPNTGFYDYANKYQANGATEICPADLPQNITGAIQEDALRVHKALRLGFYSRIDFMLGEDGTHYCLEANTLPGMTPTSLLPQEAKAAGISYGELCEMIANSK